MSGANKTIAVFTAVLVTFLAGAAFWMSFGALHELAKDNGIASPGLFPFVVDGFIIVASLAVLRGSLAAEKTLYPWLLVGAATALSIVLNVSHAQDKPLSRVMASVPPAALFLSFELLMSQLKAAIKRAEIVTSLDSLKTAVQDMTQERDSLTGQLDKLAGQRAALLSDIDQLKRGKLTAEKVTNAGTNAGENGRFVPGDTAALDTANEVKQDTIEERRAAVLDMVQDGMDKSAIADALGVSPKTIYRDIKALNGRVTVR